MAKTPCSQCRGGAQVWSLAWPKIYMLEKLKCNNSKAKENHYSKGKIARKGPAGLGLGSRPAQPEGALRVEIQALDLSRLPGS